MRVKVAALEQALALVKYSIFSGGLLRCWRA
jgi:hypothetical protein